MATKKTTEKATKSVTLSTLSPKAGSRHRRKRLGIGEGSGSGKTSGRGTKGYGARSGWKQKIGFEGGQMPLHRRLPKFGFTSRKKVTGENVYLPLNLADIVSAQIGTEVTISALLENGLVRSKRAKIKILGGIELKQKLVIEAHAASKSAKEAVEKAGGEIRIVA